MTETPLLSVQGLTIRYVTDDGVVSAVSGINLEVMKGKTLGLVGETGAGKTTTALGILRLIPDPPGEIVSGKVVYDGRDLRSLTEAEMRNVRGSEISMIFQDPMTSLNPVLTVGEQIAEVILLHEKVSKSEAEDKAKKMMEMVGIPGERWGEYPHQFSGGMKQRIVIAMALSCNPKLLLADEPTTALDVTIQAQVLELIFSLRKNLGTSMILITHDLGVVAEVCDYVAIIYAGEIVEYGTIAQIFEKPLHPYTVGLFGSLPKLTGEIERLVPIPGLMPDPTNLPKGCKFHPRCGKCSQECTEKPPLEIEYSEGHRVRCHLYGSQSNRKENAQ